jgi:nucleoside phosphorylase
MNDLIHPARLVLTAAIPDAEYKKKFVPTIGNTPNLPTINWGLIDKVAPTLLATSSELEGADAVVITWAEAEWAALQHVFCGSSAAMPYSKRNESSWSGWQKYSDGAPDGLGYWGYFRLVQVRGAKVLLFKSNVHYAAANGEQNLQAFTEMLIQKVAPALILSVGTAGGARTTDPIGTVNVVHVDALYETSQPQGSWPRFPSAWTPDWAVIGSANFGKLLFPVPTTAADLAKIAAQFNQFYTTKFPLSELNPENLNLGAAKPAINNLGPANTALLTAKSFVVANTSGNLSSFACVEMDDAIIGKTAVGKVAFGSVRNISDPIQNVALPDGFQGHWGEAIYTAYGLYTSFNGALAAWALLASQFASASASTSGGTRTSAGTSGSTSVSGGTGTRMSGKGSMAAEMTAGVRPPGHAVSPLAVRALDRAALHKQRAKSRRLAARNDAEAHRLRGRARVLAATQGGPSKVLRVEITNVYCGSDYTAQLGIGAGGAKANLILDTGSSTLAVEPSAYSGAGDSSLKPSTLLQLVTYGTGGWAGPVVDTAVTIQASSGQVPLPGCPVALTSVQQTGNFQGVDGILGLAYNGLNGAWDFQTYLAKKHKAATFPWSFGTDWTTFYNGFRSLVQAAAAQEIYPPPYFDQIETAGIVANTFAFYTRRSFVSLGSGDTTEAALKNPLNQGIFVLGGGQNETDLYEGEFLTVQVVHDMYYNTNLKSVRVDGSPAHMAAPLQQSFRQDAVSNSIVDSGTSNLSLAADVYDAILQGLKHKNPAFAQAIQAAAQNGISAASLDLAKWPNIYFTLDGVNGAEVELAVTPQTYWQTDFPAAGQAVFQISGPVDEGSGEEPANQSILGLPLLNNYYTVFDRSEDVNGVILFATIKAV